MKINKILFYLAAVLAALVACKQEESKPETPEEVLKQYQSNIDQNKFGEARALSTPAGRQWLTELEAIISNEQVDSTVLDTRFLSLSCEGAGDTLICSCVLEDQYEQYTAVYRLVSLEGQWLVDAPEEDIIIENDLIESIPDSLLEEYLDEEIRQD